MHFLREFKRTGGHYGIDDRKPYRYIPKQFKIVIKFINNAKSWKSCAHKNPDHTFALKQAW